MRQRIMIAIAMACNPQILFADEPTTALDLTMQAQILELMNQMKAKTNTSIVLITHDLGVIARMAQRILVMYAGEIIETGSAKDVFYHPRHPYTWGLMGSMPDLDSGGDRKLYSIPGTPPDLFSPPKACGFAARCEHCMPACRKLAPPAVEVAPGHFVSCWLTDPRAPQVKPPEVRRHIYTIVRVDGHGGQQPPNVTVEVRGRDNDE
jgi:oligopeptide transport system ATP-binding protein